MLERTQRQVGRVEGCCGGPRRARTLLAVARQLRALQRLVAGTRSGLLPFGGLRAVEADALPIALRRAELTLPATASLRVSRAAELTPTASASPPVSRAVEVASAAHESVPLPARPPRESKAPRTLTGAGQRAARRPLVAQPVEVAPARVAVVPDSVPVAPALAQPSPATPSRVRLESDPPSPARPSTLEPTRQRVTATALWPRPLAHRQHTPPTPTLEPAASSSTLPQVPPSRPTESPSASVNGRAARRDAASQIDVMHGADKSDVLDRLALQMERVLRDDARRHGIVV